MSEEQLVYKKKKKKFKIFPIVNAIFFILVSLLILFPMWKVIVDSFDAHSATSFRWWPNAFSVGGYNAIFSRSALYSPFVISVVTTLVGTFMGLLLATLGGYVLIQWDMPGRNFFAYMLLFTMIFDGGMVPKYLVMQNLHLLDTLWAVILPMSINVYNLVLMRNFFEGIPESLFEAAQIDGCSPMGIFKIYIRTDKLYNFQIKLRNMVMDSNIPNDDSVDPNTIANASTVVAILPFMIIYPFCQKYFVQGVNVGAVKE